MSQRYRVHLRRFDPLDLVILARRIRMSILCCIRYPKQGLGGEFQHLRLRPELSLPSTNLNLAQKLDLVMVSRRLLPSLTLSFHADCLPWARLSSRRTRQRLQEDAHPSGVQYGRENQGCTISVCFS